MDALRDRLLFDARRDVTLAWQTAALAGMAVAGKLPKLDEVLRSLSVHRQSGIQHRMMLQAVTGLPVKPISQEAIDALARLKRES